VVTRQVAAVMVVRQEVSMLNTCTDLLCLLLEPMHCVFDWTRGDLLVQHSNIILPVLQPTTYTAHSMVIAESRWQ